MHKSESLWEVVEHQLPVPSPRRVAETIEGGALVITSSLDITSRMPHAAVVLIEPLSAADAKRLIQEIVSNGSVTLAGHAQQEMEKDDLATTDVLNMLRGGVVEPAEFENGSWRYRLRTARMCVVIVFRSELEIRIVTAWRFNQ